jgi:uncharacterized protein (DUF885 family)
MDVRSAGTSGTITGMNSDDRPVTSTRTPREVADAYVEAAVRLDSILATLFGLPVGQDELPDLSPAGLDAVADLQRTTLSELDEVERAAGGRARLAPIERRCAVLLRERLEAELALHDAGEHLRRLGALDSVPPTIRTIFTLMPTDTEDDWTVIAARLRAVPAALASYRVSLAEGLARDLPAGPAQVTVVVKQIDDWLADEWFTGFVAPGPESMTDELSTAAAGTTQAYAQLRDWLRDEYGPAVASHRDPVGPERYARFARQRTGSDLDLAEAYAWGWAEFGRLDAELRKEAERVRPGSTPHEAMAWLNEHGPAIEGVGNVRDWLQSVMDDAIRALDGVHVELAEPVRRVEAMIAPVGSAAAAYYTPPSVDFSRPGRTWLPTLGRSRFPTWDLVSIWYHEGVPGHHLQLAQWVHAAPELSRYQTSLGMVDANVEGWALYAERLMDELDMFADPAARMGYLTGQQIRAIRVIIDLGMHLELEIPADQGGAEPFAVGQRWTPELALEFFGLNSGLSQEYLNSEIVRYLEMPGQAIGYKLGERAWLAGREEARRRLGPDFDLKAWHTAALASGSLGLDDLVAELGVLGGPETTPKGD